MFVQNNIYFYRVYHNKRLFLFASEGFKNSENPDDQYLIFFLNDHNFTSWQKVLSKLKTMAYRATSKQISESKNIGNITQFWQNKFAWIHAWLSIFLIKNIFVNMDQDKREYKTKFSKNQRVYDVFYSQKLNSSLSFNRILRITSILESICRWLHGAK